MTRRKSATIAVLTGLLLAALDGTLVATALPAIMDDLGGLKVYSLPVAVFMLFQTVSMPIWGRLSDMYGRARFHLAAITVLVVASVLCAFAHSMTSFIVYRAVQGLGAGGLMALSFTMIGDLYEGDARARVQGAITSVWGVAALLGPQLGGWITDALSWRYIFYLNVPIGLLAAVWVQAVWEKREGGKKEMPDVAGAVLLVLAGLAAMAGCGLASHREAAGGAVAGTFGAAALFIVLLIIVERRAQSPFLSYDLFRIRIFGAGAVTGACAMFCLFSAIIFVPYLVVGVMGESLKWGGGMLTVMLVPWMACSAMTRLLVNRLGYRTLSLAGMVLCAGAYLWLSRIGADATLLPVAGAMSLLGAGLGLTVAPLLIAAQNAVPRDRLGAATSLTQFTRSFGGAIGLALMGGILAAAVGDLSLEGIVKERAARNPADLAPLIAALHHALGRVFLCSAVAAGVGAALSLAIPRRESRPAAAAV